MLTSDLSLRTRSSRSTGQLAQDLGSSGFASNDTIHVHKVSADSRGSNRRVEHGSAFGHQTKTTAISDEEDEIDFLSGCSLSSDNECDIEPPKRLLPSQPSSHDPEHQQARSETLKNLKFKKNKSENDNAIPSKSRVASTNILESKSQNLSGASRLSPLAKYSAKSSQSRKPSQTSHKASRQPSVEKVNTRRVRREVGGDDSSNEVELDPRSVRRNGGKQKDPEKIFATERVLLTKERLSPESTSALLKPPVGKLAPAPPAGFPVSSSPENTHKKHMKSLLSKPENFPVTASPEFDNTPKNHKSLRSARPANFPLSPNASQQKQPAWKKLTSKRRKPCKTDWEGSDGEGLPETKGVVVPAAAPFPLNSPQITSKQRIGKRTSNDSAQEDDSPLKRQRWDDDMLSPSHPQDLQYNDGSDDDDYFYNPSVDANTLCPYCDEPLPSSPSPHLKNLLVTTAKKSVRAPRPTNPMGRKAAVSVFINICQRHRFESKILPEAETKGWPKSIKWDLIHDRVMRMRKHLEALMENSFSRKGRNENDGDDAAGGIEQRKRARDGCVFWGEVMKEVKEKGTRAAADVKSQFANFQNTQPGYYGELGSVLIHQSLYELYPPETTHPDLVSPLTPKEFINRVLLPEVALRLIMEDKSLSGPSGARKALEILRDSSTYGVAMFPEDTNEQREGSSTKANAKGKGKGKGKGKERYQSEDIDNDTSAQMSIADVMVKEKARRRRLELEKEDEQEMIQPKQEVGKRDRKGKSKQKNPVASPYKPKPRPKPKAIQKSTSTTSLATFVGSDPASDTNSYESGECGDTDFNMEDDTVLADWPFDDHAKYDTYIPNPSSPSKSTSGPSSKSELRSDRFPPPSSSLKPNSSGSASSNDAMDINSAEDSDSNTFIRKTRHQTRTAQQMSTKPRSLSLEMSSPHSRPALRPQPPPSSFNTDVTPKASRLSSFSRNSARAYEESRGKNTDVESDAEPSRWDNDPDSAPLTFMRRSRSKAQKAPS
ncbi:RTC4-like domain-containing protein [Lentinula aciculospora]|uniref:Restriction of telomere capping protein 4 n=1 Tax=Lentinula aciculospora TaxID=153920 RepID=A0A9W9DGX2_9AGAR|nr:RTC4-like domain-containing protein [Lentinula aciculospora]